MAPHLHLSTLEFMAPHLHSSQCLICCLLAHGALLHAGGKIGFDTRHATLRG